MTARTAIRWTAAEDRRLSRLAELGMQDEEIADMLRRSLKSVMVRRRYLARVCPADPWERLGRREWPESMTEASAELRRRVVALARKLS